MCATSICITGFCSSLLDDHARPRIELGFHLLWHYIYMQSPLGRGAGTALLLRYFWFPSWVLACANEK